MPRIRVTLSFEYDADPEHYGTDNPNDMARIDEANFEDDYPSLLNLLDMAFNEGDVEGPYVTPVRPPLEARAKPEDPTQIQVLLDGEWDDFQGGSMEIPGGILFDGKFFPPNSVLKQNSDGYVIAPPEGDPQPRTVERAIIGGLRMQIHTHGPIEPEHVHSAMKRIRGQLEPFLLAEYRRRRQAEEVG